MYIYCVLYPNWATWDDLICFVLPWFSSLGFFFFFCWLECPYFLSRKSISFEHEYRYCPFPRNSSLATPTVGHFWSDAFCFWLAYFIVCFEPPCVYAPSLPCWIICSLADRNLICLLWLLISSSFLHVFKCAKHPWKGRGQMIWCSGNNMNFGVTLQWDCTRLLLVWHM